MCHGPCPARLDANSHSSRRTVSRVILRREKPTSTFSAIVLILHPTQFVGRSSLASCAHVWPRLLTGAVWDRWRMTIRQYLRLRHKSAVAKELALPLLSGVVHA